MQEKELATIMTLKERTGKVVRGQRNCVKQPRERLEYIETREATQSQTLCGTCGRFWLLLWVKQEATRKF